MRAQPKGGPDMPTRANLTMGASEWSLLVILSMLWGGTFFFVEIALEELRPFTIVLGRVGIAALVLVLLVHASGYRMPSDVATWRRFFLTQLRRFGWF
jgi:drug/metabolite transporter (DMT)-like permease